MRPALRLPALVFLTLVFVTLVTLGASGCAGAASDGSSDGSDTTGLVLALHFDRTNVHEVVLSGATYATARRFGPFVVDEDDLPRDGTIGFVFGADDAGTAMICGESHDSSGKVLASGCDTFDVVSHEVEHGSLTLWDSR
jgi:hypothetical protein